MKTRNFDPNRRHVIFSAGAGIACIPLALLAPVTTSSADTGPILEENSMLAQKFEYVHDSSVENQTCANCRLYVSESKTAKWGACEIFPAKLVNAKGWCRSWIPVVA